MNSKLKLDLETLAVDSFDTASETAENGTVFGEQCTCWTNCTCPGCPSCDNTACGQNTCGQHSCAASCNGTCAGYTCAGTCDPWTCQGTTAQYTQCGDMMCL